MPHLCTESRRIAARAASLPIGALLLGLAACTAQTGLRRNEVPECLDKGAPACAAARERFQVVRYPGEPAAHLVAAASRALGDLNFETTRDDERRIVSGDYIDSAPTHPKLLDDLFKKTLKDYQPAALSARVEVLPPPDQQTGAEVRLRLYYARPDAASPQPIDSVAPYQIFFNQLGIELGEAVAPPPPVEPRERPRPLSPSISGV